jgi:hypothetical protein
MGHIGDVDTNFEVSVRQLPCVQGIVNILAAWRIDTANEEPTKILAIAPTRIICASRDLPVMTLRGKAVKHGLGKRTVLNIPFQEQCFRLCCFGL